jgi:hypothetical protein
MDAETITSQPDEEHLTTGWEPGLAVQDTLLRQYVFGLAETNLGIARAMDGRVLEADGVLAADLGVPNAVFNSAVLSRPPREGEWETTLEVVEEHFGGRGAGQVYLWSAWPTPDLRARGWQLEGHPPLLLRSPGLPLPIPGGDVEVREVVDRPGLTEFKRVIVEGFPFDDLQPFDPHAWLDERVLELPGHRMFVGYVDGEAATAGWVQIHGGLAVLVLGATLPRFRGSGCWSTMVRRRLEAAGDLPSASIFSDLSRPIAERHGFLPMVRFTLWSRGRER